jgi:hypothetical protein
MRATPNLNFTTVLPTPKALKDFVTMIRSVYQHLTDVINGKLGFGDGTNHDNIDGSWINVIAPAAPNTDFTVNHNLGRLPVGYWPLQKDRACDVYTGSIPATSTQLTLRATAASAVLRLFVVGLLLGLFVTRSEAQNVAYHDIALVAVNTSAGLVARPIPSALITVCPGLHTEIPCNTTATIFSTPGGASQANPFNADINGNFSFYATPGNNFTVSITGVGVAGFNFPFFAPLVTIGAIGNASFTTLTSSSANPAATGTIRLASGDFINWRNQGNTADVTLGFGTPAGNYPANTLSINSGSTGLSSLFFSDQSSLTAVGGLIRMASANSINWRNNANSGDISLTKTGAANGNIPADTFITTGGAGIAATFFSQGNTVDAVGGIYRLPSTGTMNWRNNLNSADVSLSKNASDNLVFPNGFSLGGDSAFTASPRGTFTVFLPGALTSLWTGSTWVLTKPIASLQIRTQAKTAPAGCGTNAVVRIGDGATNVDTTISAAANGGAILQTWGLTTLTVSVVTAAIGCGTAPSDVNFFMEYRTQ